MTNPTTSTITLPTPGAYTIDPTRSTVTFTTRHMFGTGAVNGTFGATTGELTVAQPLNASTVTATATTANFDSGHPKRDAQVKSAKFLHADQHPKITFTSTALTQQDGTWTLQGQLTAAGGTAPLELTITHLHSTPTDIQLQATGHVDRYAHGITKMKGLAGRTLDIHITAHATAH